MKCINCKLNSETPFCENCRDLCDIKFLQDWIKSDKEMLQMEKDGYISLSENSIKNLESTISSLYGAIAKKRDNACKTVKMTMRR